MPRLRRWSHQRGFGTQVGAPSFIRGRSAPDFSIREALRKWRCASIGALAPGIESPGAEAPFRCDDLFRGTEVPLPPHECGGSHLGRKSMSPERISSAHIDNKAEALRVQGASVVPTESSLGSIDWLSVGRTVKKRRQAAPRLRSGRAALQKNGASGGTRINRISTEPDRFISERRKSKAGLRALLRK